MQKTLVPVWLEKSGRFAALAVEPFSPESHRDWFRQVRSPRGVFWFPVGEDRERAVCACQACQGKLPRQRTRNDSLPLNLPPLPAVETLPVVQEVD